MSRKFVYYGAGRSAGLLLDLYPATTGYSLRKLRSDYTGSAIRVRRSSDNTEQDIGFDGVDLDTTSLLSFVGAGDGFVTIWYDQSNSNTNITQLTGSQQPKVVEAGALLTKNGVIGVYFDGSTSDVLFNTSTPDIGSNKGNTTFLVTSNELAGSEGIVLCNQGAINTGIYWSFWNTRDANLYGYGRKFRWATYNTQNNNNNERLLTGVMETDNTSRLWADNVAQTPDLNGFSDSNPIASLFVGYVTQREYTGFVKEIVIYDSNQEANRIDIENNINSYYGIY